MTSQWKQEIIGAPRTPKPVSFGINISVENKIHIEMSHRFGHKYEKKHVLK